MAREAGRKARWWLIGGAAVMGIGIWSMHFIGMLAFSLPIPLSYDPFITLFSLVLAIASSGFALWLVCQKSLAWPRLIAGALLMGSGIAGMHYSGMAAMRMDPGIRYSPSLLVLSILIAVAASGAALKIAFHLRRKGAWVRLMRGGAAVIMGFAITGMHYTGMAAAMFPEGSICRAAADGVGNTRWLAVLIIAGTLAVLAFTLIVSIIDSHQEAHNAVLVDSLAQANEKLVHLALHDALTQLPNRILLLDRLTQAVQAADRDGSHFALMFLDLDGFKGVNDAYGHAAGDRLLIEAAKRLQNVLRDRDTVARIGGDEFVAVCAVTDPADAATIADKIVSAISRPYAAQGQELHVSTSIGIAIYPGNGTAVDELLVNADAAMYHTKGLGRNGYSFFDDSMNNNVQEQVRLQQDLRAALARGEFVLHYQPKFNADGRAVIGAEALLRWRHPSRGLVAPDQFIPLAEKIGLIVQIGEWVLDEACRQIAEWSGRIGAEWAMAVNLSSLQFGHPGLVATVRDTLARHRLKPDRLILEITETTAMYDVESSLAILRELDALGVRIAIDDFGTGYSSLLYLKRLPASELKIDRGFVRELSQGNEDAAIVSAIVALGHTLDMRIVAEGVETADQQAFLSTLGCDSLQGFYLGKPMEAEIFGTALLDMPPAN